MGFKRYVKKAEKVVKGAAKDIGHHAITAGKQSIAFSASAMSFGLINKHTAIGKWEHTKPFKQAGMVGAYTAAAVGGGYLAAPYFAAAPAAAPASSMAAGSTELSASALAAVGAAGETAGAATSAGLALGTPAAATAASASAVGGSSLLASLSSPGVAAVAGMTISKYLDKAVAAVVNPLFAPSGNPNLGGGGSGGGGSEAGGSPFTMPTAPASNSMMWLALAAMTAIAVFAAKRR